MASIGQSAEGWFWAELRSARWLPFFSVTVHWVHTVLVWLFAVVGVPFFSSVAPTTRSRVDAFQGAVVGHVRFGDGIATWDVSGNRTTSGTWRIAQGEGSAEWISSTWSGATAVAFHRLSQRLKVSLDSGSGGAMPVVKFGVGTPPIAAQVRDAVIRPVAAAPWQVEFRAAGWVRAPGLV